MLRRLIPALGLSLLLFSGVAHATDADGDGYDDAASGGLDCDDSDADVSPEAVEICNEIDDNCDGAIDEGVCDEDTGDPESTGTDTGGSDTSDDDDTGYDEPGVSASEAAGEEGGCTGLSVVLLLPFGLLGAGLRRR